ncbi:SMP-30/gluconolactonase/LRE family protein [Herbidospora mongoliensis]|uniref:SMP-30/gluconolactonase/LRE family protein n=1 Tax=Herbidospora mongoliensis TaxID=688067 RepID=UPI00082DF82B|nr:L-dopachrome tautomerase-related protein [Herbidospora mongoliensis]
MSSVTPASPLGSWVGTDYEVVAEFGELMPTGVTVTDEGRLFVSFPRWGDDVPFTVAEVVKGEAVPYPDPTFNEWSPRATADTLVSVQSVITDPEGHVWLLDTGSLAFEPWLENGPKLVEVDPATDRVVRIIPLDPAVATRAIVQGVVRENYRVGVDGIALSADGSRLFYCPLSSRRLYSVATDALLDRSLTDEQVAATIVDLGDKGASDGLESDADGAVYATAYEHSAVVKRDADGTWSTILHAPDLLWPDTLALAGNGFLYVSVNQLPRTPLFNGGTDTRVPPYQVIRIHAGARPIRLGG